MTLRSVAVYCGSRDGKGPAFVRAAQGLGYALAKSGLTLVYGGARHGTMGAVASATLERGGKAIGVIPHGLLKGEFAHPGLTTTHFTASMHERKAMMTDLADAFIAMPGGFGTLDELFEAITWAQVGIHNKPIGLLNVEGFYDLLVAHIDKSVALGFAPEALAKTLVVEEDPETLLRRLGAR